MDKSWVSVYLQKTFKNPPRDYRGWTQQGSVIAKDKPVSLASMLSLAAMNIITFYISTEGEEMSTDEIEKEIKAAGETIAKIRLQNEAGDIWIKH